MKEILNYLKQSIDVEATLDKWNAKQYLNLQLASNYDYYLVTILAESFLLIKPIETQTIQRTKAHIAGIQEKVGYEVAILLEEATPYIVKKMLEERMAFLAVDKQMYLPFLALHIKKQHKKKIEVERREKFTAATQMVFLSMLYSDKKEFGAEELAKDLNVSAMTVLRAIDELERIGIVRCEIGGQTGRKRMCKPIEKREFYRIGKECLMNPIKRRINVNCIPDRVKAYKCGLTALGEQTMLGEPEREILAVYGDAEILAEHRITKTQALNEGLPEVLVMQYDIGRLTMNQYVDPITMILCLDEKDDRIEIAIDELMGGTEWYEG